VKRREFITLLGGATASSCALPFAALAQVAARRPRISILWGAQPSAVAKIADAFIEAMRALGYSEGRHFEVENRWAEGYLERLPAFAEEIVRRGTDLIVVANVQAAIAAKNATKTILVVCALLDDPVGPGLDKERCQAGGQRNRAIVVPARASREATRVGARPHTWRHSNRTAGKPHQC
jgi:putative tryptophan/tyrosine transport system substrate-binding protein